MKIRPLHDRVIVKRLEEERTSPGGIVIPDTAAEKPVQGKVMAVGKGKILEDGKAAPIRAQLENRAVIGDAAGYGCPVEPRAAERQAARSGAVGPAEALQDAIAAAVGVHREHGAGAGRRRPVKRPSRGHEDGRTRVIVVAEAPQNRILASIGV